PTLIEIRHLQRGAVLDRPLVRLELAEQKTEERRLAHAVRADEADPVPALDRHGEVTDDRLGGLVSEGDVTCDHDPAAGALTALDVDARAPGSLASLRAPAPERLQRADAALVACAPGFDPLPDPGLLLLEL